MEFAEKKNEEKAPCQYSEQALKAAADQAMQDVENGKWIDHEVLRKRFTA
jgi:hypothetical protein